MLIIVDWLGPTYSAILRLCQVFAQIMIWPIFALALLRLTTPNTDKHTTYSKIR